MPRFNFTPLQAQSTRRLLIRRLAIGGVAGALGMALPLWATRAAPAKLPPGEIGYQPTPKGSSRCELCVNWQAPNACKVVAGAISPNGWCGLFVRKS